MDELLAVTKALADENRVRVLLALQKGEVCVCQITELLQLAPSTVSKHLTILRQARLIRGRKAGRWMYYRLAGRDAPRASRLAIAWTRRLLADDPCVLRDRARLRAILKMDREQLCARQARK